MSTATVEIKDPSIVEIPSDLIQLGFDTDGMPKAEPTEKVVAEQEEPAAKAELEQMRRERDEATQKLTAEAEAKTKAEAEAKEAREAAEALTGKLGKTETILHDRTIQGAAAHYHVKNGAYTSVVNGIQQAKSEQIMARKALKSAKEAGDVDGEVEASERLATLAAHLATIENYLPTAEAELDQAKRLWQDVNTAPVVKEEPKKVVEPEAKKPDPAPVQVTPDQWIDNVRGITSDKAATWLKANREFVTDGAKNEQLTSFAKFYASKHGQAALKSEAFVTALTAEFAPEDVEMAEEPKDKTTTVVQEEPRQRARATPAAPVSRGGDVFSSSNLRAAKMHVPADVAALCKAMNLDPAKYVLQVREEILRGEKPKEWLDPGYDRGIR